MTKPLFNTALGALNWTLQPNLPARFKGVTARIFPLKARMDLLRAFCGSYLNIADSVVRFEPSLPYVYLMVLDYGRMAAEIENLGWVAQHEVAFAVPLEWYRIEHGKPVFVDAATVCPFIYVDNELSLSTGREVYGWPKVKAWLTPEVSPWLQNPRNDAHLLSLSTMLYPRLFAGQRQQREVLLQIRQRPLPGVAQFPPDLGNALSLLNRLPTAMKSWFDLAGQVFEMATRLPLLGYGETPWLTLLTRLLRQGSGAMSPFSPPPPLNQITLKQFRDAEHPSHACYQAIVKSQIHTLRFNGGGLLGEPHLLGGDLSGGFEILVHRYAAQPIIESLGLDVARETAVDGTEVAALAPVFPFWVDVDLEYGVGDALCWRTRTSDWYTDSGSHPVELESGADDEDGPGGHHFNTALGAALQDIAGPFDFPNATLRVLPLLADAAKLGQLCHRYLNAGIDNDVYRFEPWGEYVYLVVANFEEMSSAKANLGWWAEREVTFFVPVKCYAAGDGGRLLSVALVPILGFADSGTGAITSREVNGQPTFTAAIQSPANSWMSESGPSKGEREQLLTLDTTVFPALRLGQQAEWNTLVEIYAHDPLPYNDDVRWRSVAESWGRDLLRDHERKLRTKAEHLTEFERARALAIELLFEHQPINVITLKQFRDVTEPLSACYQAVVRGRYEIEAAYDLREIEECIHVAVHRYPSLPVVEMLGLRTKWTTTGAEAVDVLQPMRPFWMRVALKNYLGENLCWRTDRTWTRDPSKTEDSFYFSPDGSTGIGIAAAKGLDLSRQELSDATKEYLRRNGQAPAEGVEMFTPEETAPMTRAEAAAAIEAIEPQMVLDSILSREWLNWGNPRWYQGLEEKPDFCIPVASIGEKTNREKLFGRGSTKWPGWYSKDESGDA